MKVVELVFTLSRGGAETVVHDLSQALLSKGIDLKCLVFEGGKKYFKDLGESNIITIGSLYKKSKYHYFLLRDYKNPLLILMNQFLIRIISLFTTCRNFFITKSRYKKEIFINLKNILTKINPDILHIHLSGALKLLLHYKFNFPVIFTIHGNMGFNPNPFKMIENSNIFLDSFGINYTLNNVDYITSACEFFFRDLGKRSFKFSEKKKKIIPNGVSLERIFKVEKVNLGSQFKMIYIGGSRYQKGGDILIKSLPEVKKRIPNFKLFILRRIPPSHYIRRYVLKKNLLDNVEFVGFLDYPQYYSYIKSVDLAVLPSRIEGIAQSILEFMACGIPILATSVGGTPEIIINNENGILVNPNPKSIAKGIIKIYEDKNLRETMGTTNLKKSYQYDWDHISDEYIEFFNSVIDNS